MLSYTTCILIVAQAKKIGTNIQKVHTEQTELRNDEGWKSPKSEIGNKLGFKNFKNFCYMCQSVSRYPIGVARIIYNNNREQIFNCCRQ